MDDLRWERTPAEKRPGQAWVARAASRASECAVLVAGMSGLFISRLTPLRAFVTLSIVAATVGLALAHFRPSGQLAIGAFVVIFVLRYVFLFYSFTRGGIAPRLKARYGRALGFAIYEAVTAFFFAARSITFGWLLEASALSLDGTTAEALVASGAVLAAAGMIVNIWAARVVGLGTYYYGDLFMGDARVDFKVEGPYRIWRNPMYGIGQLGAYGAALMAASPLGLLAGALNQAAMYLFNWLIEQPHLRRATRAAAQP